MPTRSMNLICIEDGERYISNFDEALKTLADDQDLEYASGVWFALDEITSFLTYLDDRANELSVNVTGVRLYFAKYTADQDFTKMTLFFAPTFTPDEEGRDPGPNDPDMHSNVLNFGSSGYPPTRTYPFQEPED